MGPVSRCAKPARTPSGGSRRRTVPAPRPAPGRRTCQRSRSVSLGPTPGASAAGESRNCRQCRGGHVRPEQRRDVTCAKFTAAAEHAQTRLNARLVPPCGQWLLGAAKPSAGDRCLPESGISSPRPSRSSGSPPARPGISGQPPPSSVPTARTVGIEYTGRGSSPAGAGSADVLRAVPIFHPVGYSTAGGYQCSGAELIGRAPEHKATCSAAAHAGHGRQPSWTGVNRLSPGGGRRAGAGRLGGRRGSDLVCCDQQILEAAVLVGVQEGLLDAGGQG